MRAFFALEIPPDVRHEAAAAGAELAQRVGGFRVTREENLHVTIAFLGEIAETAAQPLAAMLADACRKRGPFSMQLGGAGWFPPRGAPSVAWIGARAGEQPAVELARAAAEIAAAAGIATDGREPHVHATIARARGPRCDQAALAAWKRRWDARDCGPAFEVGRVVLFESVLAPGGSVYTERASAPLR
ncbi:MAG TPA: RNA 2',3'-cyclic phosphodiesterase [Planctomycetota bacterium]|nr:RNA 2',3'-cyclic phosphodiesterase [Planctomycetota bacterium]